MSELLVALQTQRAELDHRIYGLKLREAAEVVKDVVGKCFKGTRRYGCEDYSEYFTIARKIEDDGMSGFQVVSFSVSPGRYVREEITVKSEAYPDMTVQSQLLELPEISYAEFDKAWQEFVCNVEDMKNHFEQELPDE